MSPFHSPWNTIFVWKDNTAPCRLINPHISDRSCINRTVSQKNIERISHARNQRIITEIMAVLLRWLNVDWDLWIEVGVLNRWRTNSHVTSESWSTWTWRARRRTWDRSCRARRWWACGSDNRSKIVMDCRSGKLSYCRGGKLSYCRSRMLSDCGCRMFGFRGGDSCVI